jgi:hypothetical protein
MDNAPLNIVPKQIQSKINNNEIGRSPHKNYKRRKSSIPLQLNNVIKNNLLTQRPNDHCCRNSVRGDPSIKKNSNKDAKNETNKSIPELAENSTVNREDKKNKTDKKDKKEKKEIKNEIENNNFYICYAQNILGKEPHLNLQNLIYNDKKNTNEDPLKNFIESYKNVRTNNHRRFSVLNKAVINPNFNKLNIDKNDANSRISENIKNKKSEELSNVAIKKYQKINSKNNPKSNRKERNKKSSRDKSRNKGRNKKNQEKSQNENKEQQKDNENENDKIKNEENNEEASILKKKKSDSLFKKKKSREKEAIENERKTDYTENTKIQKKCKFKKFLCCFGNNNDSSNEKK